MLTAAHCVLPGADYKIVEYDAAHQPLLRDVASVTAHPKFELQTLLAHRATADVALLKLAAPLAGVSPVPLGSSMTVAPGDVFTVAGLGVAIRGDGKSGGTTRSARWSRPENRETCKSALLIPQRTARARVLAPAPATSARRSFTMDDVPAIIGVVSWSTGPRNLAGCGGLTGVTPLFLYREWITRTAKILGNQL